MRTKDRLKNEGPVDQTVDAGRRAPELAGFSSLPVKGAVHAYSLWRKLSRDWKKITLAAI